ncbi:hypothetical protein CLAIMM_12353 isoform 2 [Cladophialophora immunda]|nr:hypothetical protein CLAIMM_12353 isoform 1 [Cladophialophora immunda]OQV08016.1 hypothetical protein CLAIMM_12353 isoform 2 [Cladophialophora immunda]
MRKQSRRHHRAHFYQYVLAYIPLESHLDRFWRAPDTDSKVQTPIDLLLLDDEPDDTGPVTFGPEYWRQLGEHTTLEQAEVEHALGEFKKLHTMNLTHLLNQLVLIKANVEKNGTTNKKQMTVLRKTLHHYCTRSIDD